MGQFVLKFSHPDWIDFPCPQFRATKRKILGPEHTKIQKIVQNSKCSFAAHRFSASKLFYWIQANGKRRFEIKKQQTSNKNREKFTWDYGFWRRRITRTSFVMSRSISYFSGRKQIETFKNFTIKWFILHAKSFEFNFCCFFTVLFGWFSKQKKVLCFYGEFALQNMNIQTEKLFIVCFFWGSGSTIF